MFKRQNVKMKKKYEENAEELRALEKAHEIATDELEYLRKKDEMFKNADAELQK